MKIRFSKIVNERRLLPALTIAALAFVSSCGKGSQSALHYYTEVGERRVVILPDGSLAQLNTDTQMHVIFDRDTRKIIVSRGQVFFDVNDADQRPFQVESPSGSLQVIER